ncbi:MAG: DEAD/DEAH box helicase [Pseudomonadales bacterium]|nr:DEAD/DEAH box helicase [Pseudomonadales bacterium]
MTFNELGLIKPLLSALSEQGYTKPTLIQEKSISSILDGHDLMATAQTGTGKTAAFTLPMLQRLSKGERHGTAPRALVLTPTRELAAQVQESIRTYGKHLKLRSFSVFGGVKINPQIKVLRQGIDILVATPGRLLDLHQQKVLDMNHIEILVLDEADRMLDMGFIPDIKRIQSRLPQEKQTLLFSATFSADIRKLAETMLIEPIQVDVAPRNSTAITVSQKVIPVDKGRKLEALREVVTQNQNQTLVFTRTKHCANKVAKSLSKSGIDAEAIHGNKSQAHRNRVLNGFKNGRVAVLVATDIASRGLDIDQLPRVINFELPHVAEDYVHRIGRTGRAGHSGEALSLVCSEEAKQLHAIEKLSNQNIEREELKGLEPKSPLAERREGKPRQEKSANSAQGRGRSRRGGRRRSNANRSKAA